MEAVLSRLRGLSADELREEFARAGVKCGPITATTRATFERKLARVLAGPESSATELDSSSSASVLGNVATVADHGKPVSCATLAVATNTAATSSKPTETASEELDFGYGIGLNPPEEEEISAKTSSHSLAEGSNSQFKTETSSKPAQASPTFYYGVCPLWDDVLARNGKRHIFCHTDFSVTKGLRKLHLTSEIVYSKILLNHDLTSIWICKSPIISWINPLAPKHLYIRTSKSHGVMLNTCSPTLKIKRNSTCSCDKLVDLNGVVLTILNFSLRFFFFFYHVFNHSVYWFFWGVLVGQKNLWFHLVRLLDGIICDKYINLT